MKKHGSLLEKRKKLLQLKVGCESWTLLYVVNKLEHFLQKAYLILVGKEEALGVHPTNTFG
jgi:hypothetical protein